MTDSKKDSLEAITIVKRQTITPPGYQVQLKVEQAVALAEFSESDAFKIIERVFVPQRKDHIARENLNSSQDEKMLFYFKGMAAELTLFIKTIKGMKASIAEQEKARDIASKKQ